MSVLGRPMLQNAQRYDVTDAISMDSFNLGDWKYYIKTIAGNVPYVLKGFDIIDPSGCINDTTVTIRVEDSIVYFPNSDTAPFFYGLPIDSGISDPIEPTLKNNAVNHLYLTITLADGVPELKMFWDQYLNGGVGGEYTKMVNTESYVIVEVGSNTVNFPENTIPLAKVTMASNVITQIQDCRPMFFRLGSGGYTPNPLNTYNWRGLPTLSYKRIETPSTISSGTAQNPFQGADKNIYSWKEWMDAVMSKIKEIDGNAFWYEQSTGSISTIFGDTLKSTFRSKGRWEHDTSIPGQITWTEDIHITYWGSNLDLIISDGVKTLLDNQLLYIDLQRNKEANSSNLRTSWYLSQTYVNGEAPGAFANTKLGDYIKKDGDSDYYFCRIINYYTGTDGLAGGSPTTDNPALARSVELETQYLGATELLIDAVYNRGVFDPSVISNDLKIRDKDHNDINTAYGDLCWLAYRKDIVEDIDSIESFTLAATATIISPTHSRVDSVAHPFVDGDHVYIGTTIYLVDSVSADSFTIFTDATPVSGPIDIYWATVTTKARSIGSLPVESAEHNFEDGMTVKIDGTANFDGTYLIKNKTDTTFNIATDVLVPTTETIGTATMAVIHVRSEAGVTKVLQGEVRYIGHSDTENIMKYIGQTEPSLIKPEYLVPDDHYGINGQGDYLDVAKTDNLTDRAARLSSQMADKAQDKTIEFCPQNITNVTNLSGIITFSSPIGTTPLVYITIPSSLASNYFDLNTPITLNANEAAYVTIDRNIDTLTDITATLTVVDIEDVPLNENNFIVAYRLAGTTIWLWDGTEVEGTGMSVILKSADHLLNDTRFKTTPLSTPSDSVSIYPSKRERQDKVLYSYILPNISSKFPRDTATNEYDGGTYHDQTTNLRFILAGSTVTVRATWPDATTTDIDTFTINDGEYIPVAVFANPDDSLSVSVGSAQVSLADAKDDDNIPLGGASQFKIACVVVHRSGAVISDITEDHIIDRRAFGGGGGGSGDIDREDMIYISLLQDSIYTKTFYDKFGYIDTYIDPSTTATKSIDLDPQDFYSFVSYDGVPSDELVTTNIMSGNVTTYDQFYLHVEKDDTLDIWKGTIGSWTRSRTTNVATIKTVAAHGLEVGDIITLASFGDASYDAVGVAVTAVPSSNQFSYANVGADETEISDFTGTVTHVITDYLKVEYDTGTGFVEIPVYKINTVTFTGDLVLRFTWEGTATGKLQSYGLFYNASYTNVGAESATKTYQQFKLTADYGAPYDFPIGAIYTNDGKSLDVFVNGERLDIGQDYIELDYQTIRFLVDLWTGDDVLFKENFGPFSGDTAVLPQVLALNDRVDELETKLYYNRAIYVGSLPYCDYPTLLQALQNVAVGQEIIMVSDDTISAQIDFTDIDGLGATVPACGIKFRPGIKLICDTALASSVVKFNSNIMTENFALDLTHGTAGTTDAAIEIDGDNNNHNGMQVNLDSSDSTGILTDAYLINTNRVLNCINGTANQLSGTITNAITDNSGVFSNDITIRAEV